MIWKNKFHERINELWERAKDRNYKLTQAEYSQRFGATRNALLGWLRGTGQPNADGFVRIASTENVRLSWLLGDDRVTAKQGLLQDEMDFLTIYRSLTEEHKEDLLALARQFLSRDVGSYRAIDLHLNCYKTSSNDMQIHED